MLKKMVGEMTGLSDIGTILSKSEYDKADADDYIFHEDNEQIYYVIKSLKDEYCFTNLGLIHVDGESATSSKRLVKRYEFLDFYIAKESVFIETAGTIDRDCEIKFTLVNKKEPNSVLRFNLDVKKDQLEMLKDLYKALIAIASKQQKTVYYRQLAAEKRQLITSSINLSNARLESVEVVNTISQIVANSHDEYAKLSDEVDFGEVFKKYIEN